MAWAVSVARPAQKQVAKFPAKDQEAIGSAVIAMTDDPFSGDTLKLKGEASVWRRRVGDYRIFFTVDGSKKTVDVTAIIRRTSTTY